MPDKVSNPRYIAGFTRKSSRTPKLNKLLLDEAIKYPIEIKTLKDKMDNLEKLVYIQSKTITELQTNLANETLARENLSKIQNDTEKLVRIQCEAITELHTNLANETLAREKLLSDKMRKIKKEAISEMQTNLTKEKLAREQLQIEFSEKHQRGMTAFITDYENLAKKVAKISKKENDKEKHNDNNNNEIKNQLTESFTKQINNVIKTYDNNFEKHNSEINTIWAHVKKLDTFGYATSQILTDKSKFSKIDFFCNGQDFCFSTPKLLKEAFEVIPLAVQNLSISLKKYIDNKIDGNNDNLYSSMLDAFGDPSLVLPSTCPNTEEPGSKENPQTQTHQKPDGKSLTTPDLGIGFNIGPDLELIMSNMSSPKKADDTTSSNQILTHPALNVETPKGIKRPGTLVNRSEIKTFRQRKT